jgi:hypothetical protein
LGFETAVIYYRSRKESKVESPAFTVIAVALTLAQSNGYAFVVNTIAPVVRDDTESAIRIGYVPRWPHLNTISGNILRGSWYCAPISCPAPNIQEAFAGLDLLQFGNAERARLADSHRVFGTEKIGTRRPVVINEWKIVRQLAVSQLMIDFGAQVFCWRVATVFPCRTERPARSDSLSGQFGKIQNIQSDDLFIENCGLITKNQSVSGQLRKRSSDISQNDSECCNAYRGNSHYQVGISLQELRRYNERIRSEMIKGAIFLAGVLIMFAYLICGRKKQ